MPANIMQDGRFKLVTLANGSPVVFNREDVVLLQPTKPTLGPKGVYINANCLLTLRGVPTDVSQLPLQETFDELRAILKRV